MLATSHFGIARTRQDDWFDTILDVDTELFVDPFLVFKETAGFWADAHARLIEHFNHAFLLVAHRVHARHCSASWDSSRAAPSLRGSL